MPTVNASAVSLTLSTNQATVSLTNPFSFPVINGYSGAWNIDPLDKIFFYDVSTTVDRNVYTSAGLQHANPVQVDRFGNLPELYAEDIDYSVWIANRYSVPKYKISSFGGSWVLGQGFTNIEAEAESLNLTTYAATISYDIDVSANSAGLSLSTYPATISLPINVEASVVALTLTTNTAMVSLDINIAAASKALSLTTYSASIDTGSSFALSDLFSGAEAGFAFDYTDLSTIYQDSSRTTPCTAASDPINGADDVSGNANHIGWSSSVTVGGTSGAYYADVNGSDFIQLPNATPNPSYWLIIIETSDTQAVIVPSGTGGTTYFSVTQSGSSSAPHESVGGTPTYTINGNNPTTRGGIYTELTTGSQPKLLQVDGVATATQFRIGGYSSFELVGKVYGVICRDTSFSAGEITNVLNYFGAN